MAERTCLLYKFQNASVHVTRPQKNCLMPAVVNRESSSVWMSDLGSEQNVQCYSLVSYQLTVADSFLPGYFQFCSA